MRPILVVTALLICTLTLAQAGDTLDLLAPERAWQPGVDRGETKMTLQPSAEAPLGVSVAVDGAGEDYPKLTTAWEQGQDWQKYTRLRMKVRVTCDDPAQRQRRLAIVIYDANTLREDLPDKPMTQQSVNHSVPVGRWVEYTDWLLTIKRGAIRQMQLYVYEEPAAKPTTFHWEFAQLQLEGVGDQAVAFDTEVYAAKSFVASAPAKAGGAVVGTAKGLRLSLGTDGAIRRVEQDAVAVSAAGPSPTGLLVRDVAAGGPPVMVGGTVSKAGPRGQEVHQVSKLSKLGLAVDATYRDTGQYLEVTGKVADLRGEDRAVTVYLALPTQADPPWQWWDSAAAARTEAGPEGEMSALERGMQFGLNGLHSKYPLGAVTLPGKAGLTLAVRMDEPVVHRLGYSPKLRLFYLALDFGLTPGQTLKGKSLAEAPFRILVYPHDPRWGFRSALQRYYDFFPEFFINRIPGAKQGGWFVWGQMQQMEGAKAAGFGCHWGPGGAEAVKWDNANGMLALQYIEPELYQQTMGDYTELPSLEVALDRLRKVAAGDEAELAKYEKLSYAHSYVPGKWVKAHSAREAMRVVSQATLNSVNTDADGTPTTGMGKYPWMGESKLGVIFPCNLDPDIPNGKGWFCREVYLETGLQEMQDNGAHYDGIALDSFGGYGQYSRANFRREHFQYADTPLTFSALDHKPVIAMFTSSIEWVRDLAQRMHDRKLVLMANCSWGTTTTPAWLTFAAPYLDIFGAEAPLFGDPDFIRAIARTKLCTDLPYKPVPDWQLQRNQLHGIFPGHGNKPETMAQFAQRFRDLAQAGWEPLTYATATPGSVRVERYGSVLVLHNPTDAAVEAKLQVDTAALKLKPAAAQRTVPLEAQGTVVVSLKP
jgi:hypothetical protein